jgi:hypothetical protein
MSDLYVVTFTDSLYVLADSAKEAEEIAANSPMELSRHGMARHAYRTPNQQDYLRMRAINAEDRQEAGT